MVVERKLLFSLQNHSTDFIPTSRGFLLLTSLRTGLEPSELCMPACFTIDQQQIFHYLHRKPCVNYKVCSCNSDSREWSNINYFRLPTVSSLRTRTSVCAFNLGKKMFGLQILEYFFKCHIYCKIFYISLYLSKKGEFMGCS